MKMRFVLLISALFVLSLIGRPFAQEKAGPGTPAVAAPSGAQGEAAKPAETKSEAAKPKMTVVKYRMGGLVTALDNATRKITIKQDSVHRERTVHLTVDKKAAQNLAGIQVGNEVNVWVTGKEITSLQKVS